MLLASLLIARVHMSRTYFFSAHDHKTVYARPNRAQYRGPPKWSRHLRSGCMLSNFRRNGSSRRPSATMPFGWIRESVMMYLPGVTDSNCLGSSRVGASSDPV